MYIYMKAVEEMGEYLRKSEKMNKVMMRNRDDNVEVVISCLSSGKRRKFDDVSDVKNSTSPATSSCYNCGTSEVMKNNLKSLDLNKAEGFETDNSASFNAAFSENYKRIEENCRDSEEEMEASSMTTVTKKSSSDTSVHRKPPSAGKIPPAAEIEEFLSAAEKCEQKRFSEKYNYDIVKDVPLEGRYRWVSLKP